MDLIRLEPDLSACIHTVAEREYRRAAAELLGSEEEDLDLCRRVETLRLFLESADFPQLRMQYEPELRRGKKVTFFLEGTAEGVTCRIEVQ